MTNLAGVSYLCNLNTLDAAHLFHRVVLFGGSEGIMLKMSDWADGSDIRGGSSKVLGIIQV